MPRRVGRARPVEAPARVAEGGRPVRQGDGRFAGKAGALGAAPGMTRAAAVAAGWGGGGGPSAGAAAF
jgi:hypothetical protein